MATYNYELISTALYTFCKLMNHKAIISEDTAQNNRKMDIPTSINGESSESSESIPLTIVEKDERKPPKRPRAGFTL